MLTPALHVGGYHGTSYELAQSIVAVGFEWTGSPLCFTPLDNEGLDRAKLYGELRAQERREARFSIIEAAFGPKEEDYDAHGLPQIEFTEDGARLLRICRYTIDFCIQQAEL